MEEGGSADAAPAVQRRRLELTVEVPTGSGLGALRQAVLGWGEANRRDLPWRATRDPWHVLVSEVMLQQTQVSRVLGPYRRFIERFSTPAACAAARVADVVVAWEGLGYNRRAVYLHRTAGVLVERHGGRVPVDLTALVSLPGVGAYTARAVLSFAFEVDTGVVDTNVARLLSRAVAGHPLGAVSSQKLADSLVPAGRAWAFNQSLFDIGARHCVARHPDCHGCPLRRRCRWAAAGWPPPDPAAASAGTARPQSRFAGSDREGRGRLVTALRRRSIAATELARASGWAGEPERARQIADELVRDGLARWGSAGLLELA